MSLREAVADSSQSRSRRRGGESRSSDGRTRRSRDPSRESTREPRENPARAARDRERRRQTTEEDNRRRAEQTVMLQPETASTSERRRHRSESRQRRDDSSDTRRRQIEHQSSIRSLIGSSDVESLDMDREVEEFARQIQEEGLLDGLDLDNIDLTNNDELSRKITEAYRRRQRERTRHDGSRRSNASGASRNSDPLISETRPHPPSSSRSASRQRAHSSHSRTPSATSQSEERSRYPPSASTTHLEVHEPRRRRRTSGSRDRSATVPIAPTQPETRPAARSQTDLSLRSTNNGPNGNRPSISDGRSSSSPIVGTNSHSVESPTGTVLPFSARAAGGLNILQPQVTAAVELPAAPVRRRPADLVLAPGANFASRSNPSSPGLVSPPFDSPGHSRQRPQLYQEPSITCSRCGRGHIEYELHYNCAICKDGNWNICLSCYRQGKGCLHWYGFGFGGWNKWERYRKTDPSLAEPHKLLASRYIPPKSAPGGAEGRKTLTTEDPDDRLQSGTFCVRCFAWTNDCYWRCDVCNDGDWGFCNDCVNQGRSCTHPLLPLAHYPAEPTPPLHNSPRSQGRPYSASVMTGPNAPRIGPFRALTFTTRCDNCRNPIPPTQSRYHCFSCTSSIEPDSRPGDYDICQNCYVKIVTEKRISPDNGPGGWRRCPQGHRMVVIGFQDGKGGQLRYTLQDLVGGRRLQIEPVGDSGLQKWFWYEGNQKLERLVAKDVSATAVSTDDSATYTDKFPPNGGIGWRAFARWTWLPAAGSEDELLFPKGAEIREVEDVNGEWFHGVYMGAKGLFPSPYVRILNDNAA